MILLDPDLDPYPAPATFARATPSARPPRDPSRRIPSARGLAQFLSLAQTAVPLRGKVSVVLTTDKCIRRLNRRFRRIDKATDVLSFPAANAAGTGIAGDIAISVPTALRQAGEQGHSLSVEIKVLILHGLLHLAGYDHEADDGKMARRERLLRARLGLPQGLIERSSVADEGDGLQPVRRGIRTGAALAAEGLVRRSEGDGLRPVRRGIRNGAALAAEGLVRRSEGDGLQPVRRRIRNGAALAAEGKAGRPASAPSGAKAPVILADRMYGLKPVPFKLKPVPFDPKPGAFSPKPVPFDQRTESLRLKPVPFNPKPESFDPKPEPFKLKPIPLKPKPENQMYRLKPESSVGRISGKSSSNRSRRP